MNRIYTLNGRVCAADSHFEAMQALNGAIGVFDITDSLIALAEARIGRGAFAPGGMIIYLTADEVGEMQADDIRAVQS